MRLGAVSLLVRDYDEAIAFFVGKLGFQLSEDTDMGGGRRWVRVTPVGGETSLILARATTDAQQEVVGTQAGDRVWLFLETDDFARDYAAWRAAGVHFREVPRYEPYGTVAVFEDLYGSGWDLIQSAS